MPSVWETCCCSCVLLVFVILTLLLMMVVFLLMLMMILLLLLIVFLLMMMLMMWGCFMCMYVCMYVCLLVLCLIGCWCNCLLVVFIVFACVIVCYLVDVICPISFSEFIIPGDVCFSELMFPVVLSVWCHTHLTTKKTRSLRPKEQRLQSLQHEFTSLNSWNRKAACNYFVHNGSFVLKLLCACFCLLLLEHVLCCFSIFSLIACWCF